MNKKIAATIIKLEFRLVGEMGMVYIQRAISNILKKSKKDAGKGRAKTFFLNNPCPLFIDEVQKEGSVLEEIKQKVDESDERGQFILCSNIFRKRYQ